MSYSTLRSLGSIMQIVLSAVYAGQQIRNIWYASKTGTDWSSLTDVETINGLQTVLEDMIDFLVSNMIGMTTLAVEYTSLEAIAHDDTGSPAVFTPGLRAVEPIGLAGTVGSDGLPPYSAWGFRNQPLSPSLIRNGYKRVAGVPETMSSNGILTPTGTIETSVNGFADFSESLQSAVPTIGGAFDWALVIPQTDLIDGKYQVNGGYRIFRCQPMGVTRHQISRQRGVGI